MPRQPALCATLLCLGNSIGRGHVRLCSLSLVDSVSHSQSSCQSKLLTTLPSGQEHQFHPLLWLCDSPVPTTDLNSHRDPYQHQLWRAQLAQLRHQLKA